MPPAGFWIRTGAFLLDYVFLMIGAIIVGLLIGGFGDISDTAGTVAVILYHTVFLAWLSSTPGKLLYGLRVVSSKSAERIGFGKAIGRSVSYVISSFLLGAGFWMIAFNKPHKDGWHDQIAGTHVVRYKRGSPILATVILVGLVAGILGLIAYGASSGSKVPLLPGDFYDTGRTIENKNLDPGRDTGGNNSIVSNRQLSVSVQVSCPLSAAGDTWSFGSGTLVTSDGLVLTNYHVIEGTAEGYYCNIATTDNISQAPKDIYHAEVYHYKNDLGQDVVYSNPDLDVALLNIVTRIDRAPLPSVFPEAEFGSSDALNIGDSVTFIGYPGFGGGTITATNGIVSGRVGSDYIKTSAKIDEGNSGGGAFDLTGKLVGIPTLGAFGAFEGLSYIIGIDSVRYWVQQMENQ